MKRRFFLLFALALSGLMPLAAQAGQTSAPYAPEAVNAALARGCAVLLEFAAPW